MQLDLKSSCRILTPGHTLNDPTLSHCAHSDSVNT